jgi:hypothetical protein
MIVIEVTDRYEIILLIASIVVKEHKFCLWDLKS